MQRVMDKCMKMAKGARCARTDLVKKRADGTDGRGMFCGNYQ
jgi:hypothetical protein